jgi:hypothetical protein
MRPPVSHGLIRSGIRVAATPAIAAPGTSYAVVFSNSPEKDFCPAFGGSDCVSGSAW